MIKERLTALQELESRNAAEMRKAYNALDEVLDVRQQARFRVFEEQIERRKIELLMRARQQNRLKISRDQSQPPADRRSVASRSWLPATGYWLLLEWSHALDDFAACRSSDRRVSLSAADVLTPQLADAFAKKIVLVQKMADEKSAKPRATTFTQDETNSYLKYEAGDLLPTGLTQPELTMIGDGPVSGKAIVDLDVVRQKQSSGGWFDPTSYLTGKLPGHRIGHDRDVGRQGQVRARARRSQRRCRFRNRSSRRWSTSSRAPPTIRTARRSTTPSSCPPRSAASTSTPAA